MTGLLYSFLSFYAILLLPKLSKKITKSKNSQSFKNFGILTKIRKIWKEIYSLCFQRPKLTNWSLSFRSSLIVKPLNLIQRNLSFHRFSYKMKLLMLADIIKSKLDWFITFISVKPSLLHIIFSYSQSHASTKAIGSHTKSSSLIVQHSSKLSKYDIYIYLV